MECTPSSREPLVEEEVVSPMLPRVPEPEATMETTVGPARVRVPTVIVAVPGVDIDSFLNALMVDGYDAALWDTTMPDAALLIACNPDNVIGMSKEKVILMNYSDNEYKEIVGEAFDANSFQKFVELRKKAVAPTFTGDPLEFYMKSKNSLAVFFGSPEQSDVSSVTSSFRSTASTVADVKDQANALRKLRVELSKLGPEDYQVRGFLHPM